MSEQVQEKKQKPAVPGWFTETGKEAHLIAARCKLCSNMYFPKAKVCRNPDCSKAEPTEEVLVGNRGTLWTFTICEYKPPLPFKGTTPYGIGVVEFSEGLRIAGQISSGVDLKSLKIGMPMQTVIEKIHTDDKGIDVVAWKFKPV